MCNQSGLIKCRYICLCITAILMIGLTGCGNTRQEPLRAPTENTDTLVTIETAYGTLSFPEELVGNIRCIEVVEGRIAMNVFYMVTAEGERELYRIHYADDQVGTLMGYLTTDDGEISVSYSVCEYLEQDFANDEERRLYHSMMDAFSVILNSICSDPRFSEFRSLPSVADQEIGLRYWNVTLPENVQYSETEENGNYAVEFYGGVSGERIRLYRISLGESETGNVLGWYNVEGVRKPVMIQTYDLTAYELWPEEDYAAVCRMMDTINNVILAITQSEQFSAAAE